jgi:hypothetical protein
LAGSFDQELTVTFLPEKQAKVVLSILNNCARNATPPFDFRFLYYLPRLTMSLNQFIYDEFVALMAFMTRRYSQLIMFCHDSQLIDSLATQTHLTKHAVKSAVHRIRAGIPEEAYEFLPKQYKAIETELLARQSTKLATGTFEDGERLFTFVDRNGNEETLNIVQGDLVYSRAEYEDYKNNLAQKRQATEAVAGVRAGLIIDGLNGKPTRWDPTIARNLTWYLDTDSFQNIPNGGSAEDVAVQFAAAGLSWSEKCGVAFRQVTDQNTALMVVRYVPKPPNDMHGVIAMAFFPTSPRKDRIVHIFPPFFTGSTDPTGVLRHELGHVLGFRHEHIRKVKGLESEAGVVELTPFDKFVLLRYKSWSSTKSSFDLIGTLLWRMVGCSASKASSIPIIPWPSLRKMLRALFEFMACLSAR